MLKSLCILWEHNYYTYECSSLCISNSKGARENVLVFIVSLNFYNYNNDINYNNSNPQTTCNSIFNVTVIENNV